MAATMMITTLTSNQFKPHGSFIFLLSMTDANCPIPLLKFYYVCPNHCVAAHVEGTTGKERNFVAVTNR